MLVLYLRGQFTHVFLNGISHLVSHDGFMVLVYMLTFKGYIDRIHVTIYSSTMDPMGMGTYDYQTYDN